jgi:beta-phosphoglucomutase-like phosphatase (HAD superfamily)
VPPTACSATTLPKVGRARTRCVGARLSASRLVLGAGPVLGRRRRAGLAAELAERFPRERRERHAAYPDVEPALRSAHEYCRMAVVTHGPAALQREKLSGAGLLGYFDGVIADRPLRAGSALRRTIAIAQEEEPDAPPSDDRSVTNAVTAPLTAG